MVVSANVGNYDLECLNIDKLNIYKAFTWRYFVNKKDVINVPNGWTKIYFDDYISQLEVINNNVYARMHSKFFKNSIY